MLEQETQCADDVCARDGLEVVDDENQRGVDLGDGVEARGHLGSNALDATRDIALEVA